MYKILHIILIFLFSLTMISCSADDTEKIHEPIRKGGDTVKDVLFQLLMWLMMVLMWLMMVLKKLLVVVEIQTPPSRLRLD